MTEVDRRLTALNRLREEFAPANVAHLPKVWCKACRDAGTKVCPNHRKQICKDCGNNMTSAHTDLDYVGHAEVTNRLLEVDLEWTWEPQALDGEGLPKFDQFRGLWMKLTICGVTRLGYGNAAWPPYKDPGDVVKEIIGDGIRNAAQRFGVALDQWAKTDLRADRAALVADTLTEAFGSGTPLTAPGAAEPVEPYLDADGRERVGLLATRIGLKSLSETLYAASIIVGAPIGSLSMLKADAGALVLSAFDAIGSEERPMEALAAWLASCAQPVSDEALTRGLHNKIVTASSQAVLRAVVEDVRDHLDRFKLNWTDYRGLMVLAQQRLTDLKVPA